VAQIELPSNSYFLPNEKLIQENVVSFLPTDKNPHPVNIFTQDIFLIYFVYNCFMQPLKF